MRRLFAPATLALAVRSAQAASAPSVSIDAGTIQGGICTNHTEAAYYKAIPYAAPPINDLRWEPPKAFSGKFDGGKLDGTKDPPACLQFDPLFAEAGPTDEDCLYLTVWAPANATKSSNLPVRVWLYGGGNLAGGIANPLYDGCAVPNTGAVMVSINYRLGPFGYFALDGTDFNGNQGIQDQLLGLQWVQDNIAAFGGDPKKVLLHGESAGALDSYIIATLPQATKLISSAIYESGAGGDLGPQSAVQNISTSLAKGLNCDVKDKSCLQGKSADDINKAFGNLPNYTSSAITAPAFQPSLDGKVIAKQPNDAGAQVPSVFGTNLQEGTLFVFAQYISNPGALTADGYTQYLESSYSADIAKQIEAQYPLSNYNTTAFPPIYALSAVLTDSGFLCPTRRGLEAAVKNKVDVWTYRFEHSPKCSWEVKIPDYGVSLLGATHSSEIPFVFGHTTGLPPPNGTCEMTDDEKNIAAFMNGAWTAMAANSKPADNDTWPAWTDPTSSQGINIVNSSQAGQVNYTQCKLWDDIYQQMNANATNSSGSGSGSGSGSSPSSTAPGAAATTSGTSAAPALAANIMAVLGWTAAFMAFAAW